MSGAPSVVGGLVAREAGRGDDGTKMDLSLTSTSALEHHLNARGAPYGLETN